MDALLSKTALLGSKPFPGPLAPTVREWPFLGF